jgi:glycine cleavage system H lipoate-binding protein
MATIEKFLGKRVEVPQDRRYHVKQGLWAKKADNAIVFGFSQPALILMGGIKDIDWLVEDGANVISGDSIVFAITGKILYIDAPIGGRIRYNKANQEELTQISDDPYGQGWLFMIHPQGNIEEAYMSMTSPENYLKSLQTTEGLKNPEGLKGGVSGICKAVYTGIGDQKL